MSTKATLSLNNLPIELVYRIFDHMDDLTMLCSMRNVCIRINAITDSYHRYQVKFYFPSKSRIHHPQNIFNSPSI
jgi:hypothetical protein